MTVPVPGSPARDPRTVTRASPGAGGQASLGELDDAGGGGGGGVQSQQADRRRGRAEGAHGRRDRGRRAVQELGHRVLLGCDRRPPTRHRLRRRGLLGRREHVSVAAELGCERPPDPGDPGLVPAGVQLGPRLRRQLGGRDQHLRGGDQRHRDGDHQPDEPTPSPVTTDVPARHPERQPPARPPERTRPREWPTGTSRALRATPTVLMPALGRVESPRRPPRGRRAGTPRGRPRRRGGVRA